MFQSFDDLGVPSLDLLQDVRVSLALGSPGLDPVHQICLTCRGITSVILADNASPYAAQDSVGLVCFWGTPDALYPGMTLRKYLISFQFSCSL